MLGGGVCFGLYSQFIAYLVLGLCMFYKLTFAYVRNSLKSKDAINIFDERFKVQVNGVLYNRCNG